MDQKQGMNALFTSKEWANIMEIGRGVINRHYEAAQDVLKAERPNTHAAPFEQQQPEPMNDKEYAAYVANVDLQLDEYAANWTFDAAMEKAVAMAKEKEEIERLNKLHDAEAERLHSLDAAAYIAQRREENSKEFEELAKYWHAQASNWESEYKRLYKEQNGLKIDAEYWRLRAERHAEGQERALQMFRDAKSELDHLYKYKTDADEATKGCNIDAKA